MGTVRVQDTELSIGVAECNEVFSKEAQAYRRSVFLVNLFFQESR